MPESIRSSVMRATHRPFIERTREVWQSRTERTLSDEDARQIAENVGRFFRILSEWDQSSGPISTSLTALPRPSIVEPVHTNKKSTTKQGRQERHASQTKERRARSTE